jgi:hypothetical protein
MELADEAVARLSRLALLGDGNLVLAVRDLVRSALAATPSCVAVIITIGDEEPFCALDDRLRDGLAVVRASLRAQFALSQPSHPQRHVVLLAEQLGAFKDFTATTLPTNPIADRLHDLVVDGDLRTMVGTASSGRLEEDGRVVDRAVGVLLDRGFYPDEALRELQQRARAARRSLLEQAELVLRSLR